MLKANFSVSNLNSYTFNFNQPFRARDVQEEGREYAFISERNSEERRINQEYTLNYNFDVKEHAFSLLAGYQRILEPYRYTYAQAEGYKIEKDEDGNDIKVPANILDPSFNTLSAFGDGTYSASWLPSRIFTCFTFWKS